MATLAELYEFLETKQDDSHLDSRFSYDAFLPVEQPKARLEILTWWKIERLIEDENCNFDKNFIVSYFDERVKATNNQLLKYRYNYFISLLTNDNRYAKQSIDALIAVINTLLPKDKEDYPHVAEKAIEVLMSLIKRVKYKIPEATDLIWGVLESDYGYRTKMVCIRLAKEKGFFPSRDAKKIVCLCKDLLSLVKDSWRENCCELGLFYSSKIQGEAKPYMNFFYEALGDMEMGQLVDPATAPNNIAIPWMNEDHSQKAMAFYQKAGLTQKRNRAELAFRENKKKMVMLHFKIEKKTDKKIVEYFGNLEKELLEGKLSWLLENLSCPVRFLFPSYEQIRLRMSASKSTVEKLGFENKIMDINGNSKDAGKDFDLRQKYGIWLMNIVRNTVINMILTAVNIKQLTYSKLRKWFLKNTCFGIQLEYTRSGQVVTTTWFSQIDYGVEALIKQYNRFLQGKPTDWRLPVDILSIRFEGILRDMVGDYAGFDNPKEMFEDATGKLSVRTTGTDKKTNVWFSTNVEHSLKIKNIDMKGATTATLEYEVGANVYDPGASQDLATLKVRCNGVDLAVPSKVVSKENNEANLPFKLVIENVAVSDKTTLEFYCTSTDNTCGLRLFSVKLSSGEGGGTVEPEPEPEPTPGNNLLINPGFEEWGEKLPIKWDNNYNIGEIGSRTSDFEKRQVLRRAKL